MNAGRTWSHSANVDTGGLRITIKGLTQRFIGIIEIGLMFHIFENSVFLQKVEKYYD
jgi:hypothetical protein